MAGTASAQTGALKGIVQDKADKSALFGATISLVSKKDTTHKYNAVTDRRGAFEIKNIGTDTFILSISSIGYDLVERELPVADSAIDLGTIAILKKAKELADVVVVAKTPPVKQKGDTLEYSANQFKVNPDATGEDLVKKMPGITVDNAGTVTAQGENVKKVTIDGREFFGDDATAALRNLPSEVIDKIQVFDRLSDQAQFTGFDDGNGYKAINIVTKANMRNGQFGRIYAGYGTDGRYSAGGNVSFFKDQRRISIIGLTNNINQQNFSTQDLLGVTSSSGNRGGAGGGGRGGGGNRGGGGGGNFGGGAGGGNFGNTNNFLVGQQNGISKTNSIGLNFSDIWNKKIEVTGSYFFNNTNNTNNQSLARKYFLSGDSSQFYNENSLSHSENYNHRINLRVEYKIDSSNTLILTPVLNFQNNKSYSFLDGTNFYTVADSISRSISNSNTNTSGYNISNGLVFRHAFAKRGRTISVGINTGFNNKSGDTYLQAMNRYFTDTTATNDSLQQFVDQVSNGYQVSANLAYTEPIGKKGQLQINYNPSYSKSKADQETYHYDYTGNKYSLFDSSLSNKYDNNYTTQNGGITYRVGDRNNMLAVGAAYQYATLTGNGVFPKTSTVDKTFSNILPNLMARFRFSEKSNLRLFYRASTNPPSVTQLQDVINNTNPLSLSTGNPDLQQQYTHSLIGRYSYTNSLKGQTIFANLFVQDTKDYVANASYIASKDSALTKSITLYKGSQLSKPVNLDGYWSVRSFFTFGMPIKFIKSNLNWNAGFSYTKLPGLINNQSSISDTYNYNLGAVLGSNISQYVDFIFSYSANFNVVKNSLQAQL
ncbi:MAG TPA: outer membrane beta-barrel protein, partial [Chitinophagaceae bacterium]|nr:outer membrane beta-barrel protein [Chitinophagaceae bacterium]